MWLKNLMALKGSQQNAKVRMLLVVWSEKKLRKGELNKRVIRSGEKSEDYKEVLKQLKTDGAISEEKSMFSINDEGVVHLREMLLDRKFDFQNDCLTPNPQKPGETKKIGQIGAKFGDVLLKWIREENSSKNELNIITMDFEKFLLRFKEVYLNERKSQEIGGASVIYKKDICEKFASHNLISQSLLDEYYNKLKTNGSILTVIGRDGEMIQWVD